MWRKMMSKKKPTGYEKGWFGSIQNWLNGKRQAWNDIERKKNICVFLEKPFFSMSKFLFIFSLTSSVSQM